MTKKMKTALIFPGQGSYFPGILSECVQSYPTEFKKYIEEADQVAHRFFGTRISDFIASGDSAATQESKSISFEISQFAIFLIDYLHFQILKKEGIQSDIVLGHSFGEIAAFAAAEVISFETALRIVAQRTKILKNSKIQGTMMSFACDASKAQKLIEFSETSDAYASNFNSPNQTILSGKPEDLKKVAVAANAFGIVTTNLGTTYPFHCRLMEPAALIFQEALGKVEVQSQKIAVFSPVSLKFYDTSTELAEHLTRRLFVQQVQFSQTINQLYRLGVRTFIEVGGRKTLAGFVKDILKDVLKENDDILITSTHTQWKEAVAAYKKFGVPTLQTSPTSGASVSEFVLDKLSNSDLIAKAQEILTELGRRSLGTVVAAATVLEDYKPEVKVAAEPEDRKAPAVIVSVTAGGEKSLSKSWPNLQKKVLMIYQSMTEYPEEVLELDVDLEAELGLDSVKQTQILGKIQEEFSIPQQADFQIKNYNTIRKIIDMVSDSGSVATA